jgi:DNA invertase Pin-like site-specific DNA recombinase
VAQRLVGYIRVSKKAGREDERFLSPELQRAEMERWATSRYADAKWIAWHEEIDRSGTTQARPLLAAALRDAERTGAALVVFALSRWARNVEGGLRDMDRMREAGVRVESASEPVELESAIGRFGVQILLAVAELEVGQKAEGWRSTVSANKAAGLWHGVVPFGYRRPTASEVKSIGRKSGIIVPDARHAAAVRRVFDRAAAGASIDALGGELVERGVFRRRGSVYEMLRNRAYLGEIRTGVGKRVKLMKLDGSPTTDRFGRQRYRYEGVVWIEGRHEAIVDRATFAAVAGRLSGNPRSRPRQSRAMWWGSGRVRCGGCGFALARDVKKSGTYLGCQSRRRGIPCDGVASPRLDLVEALLLDGLHDALKGFRTPSRRRGPDPLRSSEEALAAAEARVAEGLAEAIRVGLSTAQRDLLLASLQADVAAAEASLADARQRSTVRPETLESVRKIATELISSWASMTDTERRAALAALDVEVVVGRGAAVTLRAPWRAAPRSAA